MSCSPVYFPADSVVRELDGGVAVKLVSPRGTLLSIFGLPSEPQCFGLLEGG